MRLIGSILLITTFATMTANANDLDAKFLINHEGKVIGYHHVDVEETEAGTKVRTTVQMRVKLGPIPLYRYNHDAFEIWRDGRLVYVSSETRDNGVDTYVKAWRDEDVLMVDSSEFSGPAPDDLILSSYWNKALAAPGRVLNIQTGEIMDIAAESFGETPAPAGIIADHIRLVGTLTLDLWYDGARWVGLKCEIDGQRIDYHPVETAQQFAQLEDYLN